jgi:anti-anti-sigma factor
MPEQATRLKITRFKGICVVEFVDRKILDELCIVEIQDELKRLVETEKDLKLVLSFANVDHMSSAALGMLITLSKQVREKSGVLKLSDIRPQIFEVFKITRLDQMFDVRKTIKDARESF